MDQMVGGWIARAKRFEGEAIVILSKHETSPARVVVLEATYAKLAALSVDQDDLFKQTLRCAENGLFRAAHVMAWAAFMDFLEEKLASDGLVKVGSVRPSWKCANRDDLREYQPEYQIVELTQPLGLCSKNQMKALHGLLNKRNECAHPSAYYPELNETLGIISEVLQRIRQMQPKTL